MNATYNGYTTHISGDASYYGDCGTDEAIDIAQKLIKMIEGQFPGITVKSIETLGASNGTTGEDQSVCDEIDQWIADNWTAAL